MRRPKGEKVLKPVRPNAGLAAEYLRRLDVMIREMQDSYSYWITAAYRANTPEMAQDATPPRVTAVESVVGGRSVWHVYINGRIFFSGTRDGTFPSRAAAEIAGLRASGPVASLTEAVRAGSKRSEKAISELRVIATPAQNISDAIEQVGNRWAERVDETAPKLARWFAQSAGKRSQDGLQKILRDGGMSVRFEMTPAMEDVMSATIAENVGLIKSIGSQYHTEVQGMVMRSVAAGRDLGMLTKELHERYGITKRRAAKIALDQNNKQTSNITKVRQVELGLKALWLHSAGGKTPRKTHVANTGKPYDPAVGWFDPDPKVRKHIWPGELINCFPASTNVEFAHHVEKAYRHWFRGDLAEVITADGKSLCATPNHPVLTPIGWRPIGLINQGDDLCRLSFDSIDGLMIEGNKNQSVPAISEIFASLELDGLQELEIALGDEFHGDVGADSNINIVRAARPLSFGRNPGVAESILEHRFPVAYAAASFPRFVDQFLLRRFGAASALVRGAREAFSSLRPFPIHSNLVCGAATANISANSLYPNLDRLALMPELPGEGEQALAALMKAAKPIRVIGVKRRAFSGHVFNLQTVPGW